MVRTGSDKGCAASLTTLPVDNRDADRGIQVLKNKNVINGSQLRFH